MKIAINRSIGGFQLSKKAIGKLINEYGWTCSSDSSSCADIIYNRKFDEYVIMKKFKSEIDYRSNKDVIKIIEELEEEAGDRCEIKIVEVPDNKEVELVEGGTGIEWVAELHRTWY